MIILFFNDCYYNFLYFFEASNKHDPEGTNSLKNMFFWFPNRIFHDLIDQTHNAADSFQDDGLFCIGGHPCGR